MTVTTRKIVRFGGSRAVILPADWFRTFNLHETKSLTIIYGSIAIIIPSEEITKDDILKETEILVNQLGRGNYNEKV